MKPITAFATICFAVALPAMADEFYAKPGLFSTRPSAAAPITHVTRFGPVGLAIDLMQPAFVMRIRAVEPGSPAAATGKLKAGRFIQSINGEPLAKIDPRIQMGNWITEAEATDGRLVMQVADTPDGRAERVVVQIPVLGRYSDTWPLNCAKSDRIVRNMAEYLKKPGSDRGFADIGMLFLLSTGDADDLAYVAKWAKANTGGSTYPWHIGFGGLALCEYYLKTGDESVLPAIQKMADRLVELENFGGWAGRGSTAQLSYGGGGGHLNAGGTLCAAYLALARECGATIPDETLRRVVQHFYRWAGRGNNSYGNNRPESSFVDNGKNGTIAFAMAAAASLSIDGEGSIYARARDAAAMTSFYTTTYMLHGHTGGGIGEVSRSNAMGLLYEKRPTQYRSFMDERRWHYELSRRFDGSMAILGGARYDNTSWGAGYALAYTIPRKTLRLTGAPPTKYAKPYQLPKRPWGAAADDVFTSLEPATLPDGTTLDVSNEKLPTDSGKPFIERMLAMDRVPDDVLRRYAHHPDYLIRLLAARKAVGVEFRYMGGSPGGEVRDGLILELLRSKDPRVRKAILAGLNSGLGAEQVAEHFTPEVFAELVKMLDDPQESWYVKDGVMMLMGKAPADWVAPHVDTILGYLDHEEWWLRESALQALAPVVADERCYRKVLPAVGKLLKSNHNFQVLKPIRWGAFPENLRHASPAVRALAKAQLKEAYVHYVQLTDEHETVNTRVNETIPGVYAQAITQLPGGYDLLYQIGKQKYPDQDLPFKEILLNADSSQFSPELRRIVEANVQDNLIPGYVRKNRPVLLKEAKSEPLGRARGAMAGLVGLYRELGVDDYNWANFGPAADAMSWYYFSFDPKEKFMKADDRLGRWRDVTFPAGTGKWFAGPFDPKAAGWKRGLAPFGAADGQKQKPAGDGGCNAPFCQCATPIRTLWEKDVLLIRGEFEFPPLEDGYRYRLLHGGISHVGSGGGYQLYVNGKLFDEQKHGVDRRAGGRPVGRVITTDWWDDFNGGKVTLAAISFKKHHPRTKKYGGNIMFFMQRMKVPPIDDE